MHLVLENDANQARFLGPGSTPRSGTTTRTTRYHVLATGESDGYYVAYADAPAKHLARCLAEGFAYQGEVSPFSRRAARRAERATCRRPRSSTSCRTTTRSATARSASG